MSLFHRKYGNYYSLYGKTRVALALMTVIPLLMAIYLLHTHTELSDQTSLTISAIVLLSILSGFALLRTSADQLGALADQANDIEADKKDQFIKVKADREVSIIAASVNTLLSDIASAAKESKSQTVQLMVYARDLSDSYEKLKAQEELRNKLSRYVGKDLVEKLQNELTFESEKAELTILFVDIRSFTTISERLTAEDVVTMLNEYFDAVVDIILGNNGHLDKFVGDEIMAVFGVLPSQNNSAQDAVSAALAMQQKTKELMEVRAEVGKQVFEVGIGINTGEVIMGNVGSKNRMDYTVIGDVVNTAARFELLAKGGEIIVGEKTFYYTQQSFDFIEKGAIALKNKTLQVNCYSVIAVARLGKTIDSPV